MRVPSLPSPSRARSAARPQSGVRLVLLCRAFRGSAAAAAASVVTVVGAAPAVSRADTPSSGSVVSGVTAVSRADFDGGGHPDVAIAAPGGTINGRAEAGYVAVVHGPAEGPGLRLGADRRRGCAPGRGGVRHGLPVPWKWWTHRSAGVPGGGACGTSRWAACGLVGPTARTEI
ncbi:FG-GAP repeat protein [Streptomyces sp. NPDC005774]|uniref:FG-GAP repeat protein n=1 Tax=Streptomyces sp. NPDC005774 TaxID=3364728 RepID=UPI00367ED058